MKTVYPSAFIFRQEKNIPGNYDRKKYEKFQLTVESNIDDGVSEEENHEEKRCKHLSASSLIKRRKQFHQKLIQIVRNHHKVRETRVPQCLSSSLSQVSDFPLSSSPHRTSWQVSTLRWSFPTLKSFVGIPHSPSMPSWKWWKQSYRNHLLLVRKDFSLKYLSQALSQCWEYKGLMSLCFSLLPLTTFTLN